MLFRIYNVCFKEESFRQSLESFQSAETHLPDVQFKLRNIKQLIKDKNINSFWNINKIIEDIEGKVAVLEDSEGSGEELEIARINLEELQLTRDNMLRQQLGIFWLKNEDENSKFFHQPIQ